MSKSILQDWVAGLGLRHQGVLLTCIRGCDTAPKEDASKALTRCLRAVILNAHCGDPRLSASFIEWCDEMETVRRFDAFRKNCDQYPFHFVMHILHAIEVIAYHHPEREVAELYRVGYYRICYGMHINPELPDELNRRLDASEEEFARHDVISIRKNKNEV